MAAWGWVVFAPATGGFALWRRFPWGAQGGSCAARRAGAGGAATEATPLSLRSGLAQAQDGSPRVGSSHIAALSSRISEISQGQSKPGSSSLTPEPRGEVTSFSRRTTLSECGEGVGSMFTASSFWSAGLLRVHICSCSKYEYNFKRAGDVGTWHLLCCDEKSL